MPFVSFNSSYLTKGNIFPYLTIRLPARDFYEVIVNESEALHTYIHTYIIQLTPHWGFSVADNYIKCYDYF